MDPLPFLDMIYKTSAEVEREMTMTGKYWMVHRVAGRAAQGPSRKHPTFEKAATEAERLTRKELTRFVVLEAVMGFEPYEPISIAIQRIGRGPSSEYAKTTGPVGLDDSEPPQVTTGFCRSGLCTFPDCDCGSSNPESPPVPDYCRAEADAFCIDPDCDCAGTRHETHQDLRDALAFAVCARVEEHEHWCCPREPEETEPEPMPGLREEREECGCYPGNHTCPEDRQPDYHAASGSGAPGCSCWWCDPENHDVENCEFPHCGCKNFLKDLADNLRAVAALEAEGRGPIPKADCPCGCSVPNVCGCEEDEDCFLCAPSQHQSDLSDVVTRGEWLPKPSADLSSAYAGWSVEEFERALTLNRQARSDLCAGLLERRGQPEPSCDCHEHGECEVCRDSDTPDPDRSRPPGGFHWCPHCGYNLTVERPEVVGRGEEN